VTGDGVSQILRGIGDHNNLERIKASICCLCCLFTFGEKYSKDDLIFRSVSTQIIENLLFDGNTIDDRESSKFWVHYLTTINRAVVEKHWDDGFDKLAFLWDQISFFLLDRLKRMIDPYKILILRKGLELEIFEKYQDEQKVFKNSWEFIQKTTMKKINEGIDEIQRQRFLRQGKKEIFSLMEKSLLKILSFKTTNESLFKLAILTGRFDKMDFDLKHTIIVGEDGGWYILMNSITNEEKEMIIDEVDSSKTFQEYLQQKIQKNDGKKPNEYKIIIGKGSFGKIRLGIALIVTEKSRTGESSLICGEVICLKKSRDDNFSLKIAVWNDYVSDTVGKNIHSPEIYDMTIICSCKVNDDHNKGYAIQEFAHFVDGSIFRKKNSGLQIWLHQKTYLIDIFSVVLELMKKGIAMTDLKPQNTLYDKVNRVGKLIDLAGVVRKNSYEELQKCKRKYIREYTPKYTAPELQISKNSEDILDLTKALAYSMGKMIQVLVLNPHESDMDLAESSPDIPKVKAIMIETLKKKEKNPNECPDFPRLTELTSNLMKINFQERLSYEKGLEELKLIGPNIAEETVDFQDFIEAIRGLIDKNPESLGLKSDINKIAETLINVKVTNSDPEIFPGLQGQDLEISLKEFIEKKDYQKEPTFLLLGSAGTGKSTMLQLQFINLIKKWNPEDPIPFFMNLATNLYLQERWYFLNQFIQKENKTFKPISFSVFSGVTKYPLVLLLDSFDESRQKSNLIKKFMKDLGNNSKNKAVISCRTDYLKVGCEEMWFRGGKDNELLTKYIAPLDSSFDLMRHITNFTNIYKCELSGQAYKDRIELSNLKEMMKTNYMVYLTLTVLPEFGKGVQITKYDIYKKYAEKMIKHETSRYNEPVLNKIKEQFKLPKETSVEVFFDKIAQDLAVALHSLDQKRVDGFLEKYEYSNENQIFKDIIIKCLNLHLESMGEGDILVKFPHDTIKNFYLVKAIFEESDKGKNIALAEKSIVNDETLVRFFAEAIRTDQQRIDNFKKFIYLTKNLILDEDDANSTNQSSSILIAAANAITILIAANVPFVEEDLTKIKICNANLRDGIFNGSDFTDADLSNVNMVNCKLNETVFIRTNLKNIKLGIEPDYLLEDKINSMDMTNNGSHLVTANKKGGLSLYNLIEGGHALKIQKGIDYEEMNVAIFSADRALIGSGGKDQKIRISDSSTGKKFKNFEDTSAISCLAFSRDRSVIVSGSREGIIKLWDLIHKDKDLCVKSLTGHIEAITAIVFTSDDCHILSASRDKTIKLWNLNKNEILRSFVGHNAEVTSLEYSNADKDSFISGSKDFLIKLWDMNTGKLIRNFEGHRASVNSLRMCPNGKIVLSGSEDKSIKLWDKTNGNLIKTLEGHLEPVITAMFSSDGLNIISVSKDNSVKFWERNPGTMVKSFNGQNHYIYALAVSKDGSRICSGSADKTVKVFDRNTGNLLRTFEGHENDIKSVSFSPDKKLIASASFDNNVKIWDVENGLCMHTIKHDRFVNSVVFSPDGSILASGSLDKTIKIWDVLAQKPLKTLKEPDKKGINALCFSPDGLFLASSSENHKGFRIWNIEKGFVLHTFIGHQKDVLSIVYSPDGTKIATGSMDKTIIMWNAKSFDKMAGFEHLEEVNCVAFSPDGKLILSGGVTIKVWDITRGSLLKSLEGHNGAVKGVIMTDDNQTIISCSTDKTIRLWERSKGKIFKKSLQLEPGGSSFVIIEGNVIKFIDVIEGTLLNTLIGHNDIIKCYCFSKQILKKGNFILTGSADRTIKQWNYGTGKCSNTYEGHTGPINSVLYTLDESLVISASDDKTIKIWNKVSSDFCFNLMGHEGSVLSLALSQDGKKLLSGGEEKTVRLWSLETKVCLKVFKATKDGEFQIRFVDFSKDENMVFGFDNNKIVIWEMGSEAIIKEMDGIEGLREVRKIFNEEEHNFYNRSIISPDETSICCSKMFMKNCLNLSEKNMAVFTQKNAIILKEGHN